MPGLPLRKNYLNWAQRRPAVELLLYIRSEKPYGVLYHVRQKEAHLMLLLTNSQKVELSVQPLDQYGNPARIDGMPTWAVSDAAVGTFTAAADGLSGWFETTGALGSVQVSVQADADLGQGVRPLAATLDIQVEASEAVSLSIKAGAPEPR